MMTVAEAQEHIPFRASDTTPGVYEMAPIGGWGPCSKVQSQWLDAHKDKHIPLGPVYRAEEEYTYAEGLEVFGVFIVEGLTR